MGKISIQDLSSVLVEKRGLSKKDASNFISEMFDIVQQELEKEKIVKIKGLGTFKIIDVDDRESVNVNTGERVLIEGHGKITFTPDSLMKELVNKPFSQFETVVLNDGVEFEDPKEEVVEPQDTNGDPSSMALVDFGLGNVKADLSSFPVIGDDVKKEETKDTPSEEVPSEVAPAEETPADDKIAEEPAKQEPVVEEPATEEPASDEIRDEDVVYDDEEETSGSKFWLWMLIGCMVGLACGYLLGNYFPFINSEPSQPQEKVAPAKPIVKKPVAPAVKDSTATVEQPTAESEKPAVESEKPAAKSEKPVAEPEKPAQKTEAASSSADATAELSAKYAAKDRRVQLGAYHIVGTAKVVKAKEGETLGKISRRYLGPDMECYLEVYNDLKANDVLKAGQEVKIPKLVWKKAERAKRK
jgi:nucleoid DNA-binding protein/LysM repeat protein